MIHRKSDGDKEVWTEGAAASSGIEDGERFAGPDPEPLSVDYDSPENVEPVSGEAEPEDFAGRNLAREILRKSRALDESPDAGEIMDPYRRGKAALEKQGLGKSGGAAEDGGAKPRRQSRRKSSLKAVAEAAEAGVSPAVLDQLLSGSMRAPEKDEVSAPEDAGADPDGSSRDGAVPEVPSYQSEAAEETLPEDPEAAADVRSGAAEDASSSAGASIAGEAESGEAVPDEGQPRPGESEEAEPAAGEPAAQSAGAPDGNNGQTGVDESPSGAGSDGDNLSEEVAASDNAQTDVPFSGPAKPSGITDLHPYGKGGPEFSFSYAKEHSIVITRDDSGALVLYAGKIPVPAELAEARRIAGGPFRIEHVKAQDFPNVLSRAYQRNTSEAQQLMNDLGAGEDQKEGDFFALADDISESQDLLDSEDDAPIIRLINAMFSEAIKEGASDIHVETYEKYLVVRFRIDGILKEIVRKPKSLASPLISRIKVMSRLDIAEKRLPQDGRISLTLGGRAVDVRVSTLPSSHGERVVMRILDKNTNTLNLQDLGMTESIRERLCSLIRMPHGIILVTGPTGSGKSTTLYASLSNINSRDLNIMTVEDPVEYDLDGISQTQVNAKAGMTFAKGLRAILRQDPDVVMIGEIRDFETADIAVQASMTGHLVLSTLHTNTAIGAITRLHDMGVEPFLLSTSLIGVLAQRLVRTLCPECRVPCEPNETERELLGLKPGESAVIYRPKAGGCPHCGGTGFKGRTGIHELVTVDENVRRAIHDNLSEQEIERIVRPTMPDIMSDGMKKVLAGKTSIEEVLRVAREE